MMGEQGTSLRASGGKEVPYQKNSCHVERLMMVRCLSQDGTGERGEFTSQGKPTPRRDIRTGWER